MQTTPRSHALPRLTLAAFGCATVLSIHAPAQAHHSFSMYDSTKLLQLEGTVKEFQWTNPHVMMWLVKDADPAGEVWTIELPTSPGNLSRMNWSKRSLKPGDHVVVELNPLRDGQHGGSFKKATLLDTGVVLVASAPGQPGGVSSAQDSGVSASDASAATAQPASASADRALATATQIGADAGAATPPASGCACDVQTRSPSHEGFSGLCTFLGIAWLASRRSKRR